MGVFTGIFARAAGHFVQNLPFFAIFCLFFAFPYKVREFLIFLQNRRTTPFGSIFLRFFRSPSSRARRSKKSQKNRSAWRIKIFSILLEFCRLILMNKILLFLMFFLAFFQNSIKILKVVFPPVALAHSPFPAGKGYARRAHNFLPTALVIIVISLVAFDCRTPFVSETSVHQKFKVNKFYNLSYKIL